MIKNRLSINQIGNTLVTTNDIIDDIVVTPNNIQIAGILTNGSGNARIDATIAEIAAEQALENSEIALAITRDAALILARLDLIEKELKNTQITFLGPEINIWAEFDNIK